MEWFGNLRYHPANPEDAAKHQYTEENNPANVFAGNFILNMLVVHLQQGVTDRVDIAGFRANGRDKIIAQPSSTSDSQMVIWLSLSITVNSSISNFG